MDITCLNCNSNLEGENKIVYHLSKKIRIRIEKSKIFFCLDCYNNSKKNYLIDEWYIIKMWIEKKEDIYFYYSYDIESKNLTIEFLFSDDSKTGIILDEFWDGIKELNLDLEFI